MISHDIGVNFINVPLNAGADPNIADCDGEVLQAINRNCTDVPGTIKNNVTALMIACAKGNIHAINILLNAEANSLISDSDGYTYLRDAVRGGFSQVVLETMIIHGADVNTTSKNNKTLLMIASENGNTNIINVLLNALADPNNTDDEGDTCLHYAARNDCCTEVIQAIISHGADVNATNKTHATALMLACANGNIDALNALLNAGGDPNLADAYGDTCLHYIARNYCCTEVLQPIISHDADVNATNNKNVTALMLACVDMNEDAINVLLNAGADPNIADDKGATCIHHAVFESCSKNVLEIIVNHGRDVNVTNKNNRTALLLACKEGNKDIINLLLNAGADPNIIDANGATCIHYAVVEGCSKDVLEIIVNHGADVNATDKNHVTALMLACVKGNKDVINVLLNAGADPNIADGKGATCIYHAVGEGCSKDVLETIVNHGADVNAKNKFNRTALLIACVKGNKDAINILLNAGADPNVTDYMGAACIHHVVGEGCSKDVLEIVVNHGADIDAINKTNATALMLACEKGKKDAIDVLLNAGANPNFADADGDTCLHYIARNDCCTEVVQAVISHGADVNVMNENNVTALMIACVRGNMHVINVLLNAGANPRISDADDHTWLHEAVRGGYSQVVLETMINHGADVNATIKNNRTALMIATVHGNRKAIYVLLSAGADPNSADADGDTCLHYAVRNGCCAEVLQAIISLGVDVNATNKRNVPALMLACEKGKKDAIDVLLNAGANPNFADADGDTCLHYIARNDCCTEVVQAVISHGADVNVMNENNVTALMIACGRGNMHVINVLLNAGANPRISDADDHTWLHEAVRGGYSQVVLETMINHGADVNATIKNNRTPVMIACENGNENVINVLLSAGADPNIADADGYTCLHDAVGKGCSKETLQVIVEHGADVNATNKYNETALLVACQKLNADAINVLLSVRADPTIADYEGYTCLHHGGCSKENLQAMIDHGADVNATNKMNQTALLLACQKRNSDAMRVLLNSDANPNIADVKGDTLLHNAIQKHVSKETLQSVIDHGADVNLTQGEGGVEISTSS